MNYYPNPDEMRHFKRPDGTVFHKYPTVTDKQVKAYLAQGCIEVDIKGKPLNKAPKE